MKQANTFEPYPRPGGFELQSSHSGRMIVFGKFGDLSPLHHVTNHR